MSKPTTPARQPTRADWLRYVMLIVLWGSAFSLSKISVAELPPSIITAARIWIAIGLLYGWMVYRKHKLPVLFPKPDIRWAWLLPIGITGAALPFWLNTWAMQTLDSGLVSILLACMPLMVAVLAHFSIAGDRMTANKIAGLALGLFGIILLVGPAALRGLGGPDTVAQFVILVSALLYATNSILIHFMPETPPSVSSAGMLLIAGLVLVPLAILDAGQTSMPSVGVMFAVLFLGLGVTGFGSIIYMQIIRSAGPSFMVTANYFVPPFAVFIGVLFLGESPSIWAYAALFIITLGIILERRKSK
ncbi:MAG: EamA family transporter [Robiginitomaculum sp.]|nr:EamA family transporter [Robiginitomaculum sp.]